MGWMFGKSRRKQSKKTLPKQAVVLRPRTSEGVRRRKPFAKALKGTVRFPVRLDMITRRKKSILTVLALLSGAAAVGVVFFSQFFIIDAVSVTRTDLYVNSVAISRALEGIKGSHILMLNTSEVERVIYERFPEIKRVHVSRMFPRALRVELTSYDVLARIRNAEGKEYFINEAGVAVNQDNEQNSLPLIEIPRYTNVPEDEQALFVELVQVREYKQVMSQEQLFFILEAKRMYEEFFAMGVTSIMYLPIEDEIRMETERGFWVWMSLRPPVGVLETTFGEEKEYLEQQVEKLRIVLGELDIHQRDLAYVDLRISGKVIYCEAGAECAGLFERLY